MTKTYVNVQRHCRPYIPLQELVALIRLEWHNNTDRVSYLTCPWFRASYYMSTTNKRYQFRSEVSSWGMGFSCTSSFRTREASESSGLGFPSTVWTAPSSAGPLWPSPEIFSIQPGPSPNSSGLSNGKSPILQPADGGLAIPGPLSSTARVPGAIGG